MAKDIEMYDADEWEEIREQEKQLQLFNDMCKNELLVRINSLMKMFKSDDFMNSFQNPKDINAIKEYVAMKDAEAFLKVWELMRYVQNLGN